MTTNKETHDKHLTTTGKSEIDTSRGEPTYEGRFSPSLRTSARPNRP